MRKVLITGGTGLVGSAIKNGTKLSTKDGDLRKWETTLNIFNHISFIHYLISDFPIFSFISANLITEQF